MSRRVQLNEYGEMLGGLQRFYEDDGTPDCHRAILKRLMMKIFRHELTHRQQQVMELYFFENLTMAEVGSILGINKSTVCRIIQSGKKRISTCMKYLWR